MKKAMLVTAVAMAVIFAVAPVLAQDGPPATEASAAVSGSAGEPASLTVLDVVGKLVIVLAIAWGAVRAVRWWHDRQATRPGDGGRHMWLEETLSLGADGRLYLVEVEGRRMLLTARDGNVVEVADVSAKPVAPATYRSVRKRSDGSTDELNVRADISTRAVRPDVVERDESWEERRGRLLRELQEQG